MSPLGLLVAFLGACLAVSLCDLAWSRFPIHVATRFSPLVSRWKRKLLDAEVAPSIRLVADSIDAGMTIPSAAARAGAGKGAASRDLARLAESCSRGLTVSDALHRLTSGANGDLWAPVAFTIELHFRQGGDLAHSLREVAQQLESRRAGRDGAESATAQARFTANLVCAMPLLALAGLVLLTPDRVAAVTRSPLAMLLMVTGLALQCACLIVIRRIARS
jgi:Flp pilus assembly protein TadB